MCLYPILHVYIIYICICILFIYSYVYIGTQAETLNQSKSKNEVVSLVEQRRQKFMSRKKDLGTRQDETMKKLLQFTSTIRKEKQQVGAQTKQSDGEHCFLFVYL